MLPNLTFEQYKNYYYDKGKTIDQINKPKNPLSEVQLKSKYQKYLQKLEKQEAKKEEEIKKLFAKEPKVDEKWNKVKTEVQTRDQNCQLWYKLTRNEREIVMDATGYFLLDREDSAHVFPRSVYPHMKYDPDNVVLLTRLFHSRLDHFQHPVTGKQISKEEQIGWWVRIVGTKRYDRLIKKAKQKKV